jgi:hypothetical protein
MTAAARIPLNRDQILAHRRAVGALDRRLPTGTESLREAALAGLQDSMPRAALLSIHARVEGTEPVTWEDQSLIQVWGPRFSAFVVAAVDRHVFTLGRLPDDPRKKRVAEETADRLERFLDGRTMTYGEAGRGLGVEPNSLRYGAPTGRILIRWDGARQPTIWMVPAPDVDPLDARLELARRYLHVFGPGSADSFAAWAGIKPPRGQSTFAALSGSLAPVATPTGDAWILASDEASFRDTHREPTAARLLPSGDTFFLLWGLDRELLVPDPRRRGELWTSRVWPGAVVAAGEVVGTWRRAAAKLSIQPWRRLTAAERRDIEAEAASLPLPDVGGQISVRWDG